MFTQRIKEVMLSEPLLTAGRGTTVSEAARMMAERRQSAVVVLEAGRMVGIFTERDAVIRVIAAALDPRTTELAQVMTPDPVTLGPEKSFGHALTLMHERGIRHVPVVEGDKVVGIVTARDALDPDLEEFVCEAQRRQSLK